MTTSLYIYIYNVTGFRSKRGGAGGRTTKKVQMLQFCFQ